MGASEHLLGWQLSLFGVGAALGAMIAPKLVARFGSGITLFAGFLAEATCLSLYGMVSRATGSMVVVLILGVVLSIVVVPFYSILQTIVDEKFLGRVFSLVKQSESVAVVLAMIAAVTLQSFMGSHLIFLFAGLIYLSFTALSSLSPGGRALLATR
jgi:MFS family permease